jgi:hypothetical protein
MDDELSDADNNWDFLSEVIENSNLDEDLVANNDEVSQVKDAPKTVLEVQIQNLASPNTELSHISGLHPGKIHIHAQFSSIMGRYLRRDLHITEAIASDSTASVRVVWFNQPYKASAIRRDVLYEIRGNYGLNRGRFQISNAKIRPLTDGCKPFERGEQG